MNALDLHLPETRPAPRAVTVEDVRRALESLPKLNEQQAFEAVHGLLRDLNRTELMPAVRFDLAECILDQVEYLSEALCRRCEHLEFPVPDHDQTYIDRVQSLLTEMAIAYEHVVVAFAERSLDTAEQDVLQQALLRAMQLLSLRVLQAYSVYDAVPGAVWRQLHRLYGYAERIDVARIRVEHLADQSVGDIYKRVLLLALANPFHLMQREARMADERLAKWALACRLSHPAEYPPEDAASFYRARFHVDLAGEGPPGYGLVGGQPPPTDARLLDIKPVAKIAEDRIRALTLQGNLSIRERLERDLLRRLRNAWTGRAERAAERNPQPGDVQIVGGLRACHHAVGGGAVFQPEEDEVALHGGDFRAGETLSLVPLNDEPWRQDDARGKLEQGLIRPRHFGFDVEGRDDDVWERSTRVGSKRSSKLEEQIDLKIVARRGRLQQRDRSAAGIGAVCPEDSTLRFRVGDLVGIAEDAADTDAPGRWQVGVVCWLRNQPDGQLSLGLRRVDGSARAVAARGIEGTGAAGDYHRVLAIQRAGEASLIVPAGTFDLGSLVLVNEGDALALQRLGRVLQSTKGFAEHLLEPVAFNPALKDEVIASLYRLLEGAMP